MLFLAALGPQIAGQDMQQDETQDHDRHHNGQCPYVGAVPTILFAIFRLLHMDLLDRSRS